MVKISGKIPSSEPRSNPFSLSDILKDRPIRDFRIEWLEAFVAVAEHGSQAAAGKVIGKSQATVSRYVSALETWTAQQLVFEVDPSRLTERGAQILPFAIMITELVKLIQPSENERGIYDPLSAGMRDTVEKILVNFD